MKLNCSHFLGAFVHIATRTGIETTQDELRRVYALVEDEAPAETLIGMARELGIELRPMQIEW
ncbi:MAG: hypothetical protein IT554_04395, partial [Sphingomonadaceae bacterium]|nr:hypothetical protein [Sphingomonadaceae bacterium]